MLDKNHELFGEWDALGLDLNDHRDFGFSVDWCEINHEATNGDEEDWQMLCETIVNAVSDGTVVFTDKGRSPVLGVARKFPCSHLYFDYVGARFASDLREFGKKFANLFGLEYREEMS